MKTDLLASTTAARVAGRVLGALVVLFLLMDSSMKLLNLDVVRSASVQLGYPVSLDRILGVILLAIAALYALPRTSVLGAILLTGYLGGAIATQLRVGNPLFSHTLFGLYLGLAAWSSLYLRNASLRAVIPVVRQ